MKILITGASGFIGSFIVEEALRRGFETWAAVRSSSSRQFLTDNRIHFIELDFSSETQMTEQLTGLQFDYIVHAAGVTKCLDKADFHRINTEGTQHLVHVLKSATGVDMADIMRAGTIDAKVNRNINLNDEARDAVDNLTGKK